MRHQAVPPAIPPCGGGASAALCGTVGSMRKVPIGEHAAAISADFPYAKRRAIAEWRSAIS